MAKPKIIGLHIIRPVKDQQQRRCRLYAAAKYPNARLISAWAKWGANAATKAVGSHFFERRSSGGSLPLPVKQRQENTPSSL